MKLFGSVSVLILVAALVLGPVIPAIAGDGNIEILGAMAGEKMPVPSDRYVVAREGVVQKCDSVTGVAYEAADGSTVDDEYFPMIAWFIGGKPFLAISVDSVSGAALEFWFDQDRDGFADEYGDADDLKVWLEAHSSGKICEIVKEVE